MRGEVEWLLEGIEDLDAAGQLHELEDESESSIRENLPERIGPYRIHGVLGGGGQGVVYEAEQRSPRRRVALKVLRVTRADLEHHARLFRREIRIQALLTHPCIAAIYESGQTAERNCFFTMELVDGVPLDQYVRDRAANIQDSLELFLQVCDAVQHAHERGVIHRDLKPSNILVDRGGRPKVLDFGLARLSVADLQAASVDTETTRLQGTLPYMSPEQVGARNAKIDHRTDVYSLGVILYEILTGERPLPLEHKSLLEVIHLVGHADPLPPSRRDRRLTGDLETVLLVALAKDPQCRYTSVADLAEDLRRHLRHEPIRARAPSVAYRIKKFVRRNSVSTCAAGLLLVLAAVFSVTAAKQAALLERERGRLLSVEQDEERARREADQRALRVQSMERFAKGLLASANPYVLGPDMQVRDVVDDAAGSVEELFAADPVGEIEMRVSVAKAYRFLSLPGRGGAPPAPGHRATEQTRPRQRGHVGVTGSTRSSLSGDRAALRGGADLPADVRSARGAARQGWSRSVRQPDPSLQELGDVPAP